MCKFTSKQQPHYQGNNKKVISGGHEPCIERLPLSQSWLFLVRKNSKTVPKRHTRTEKGPWTWSFYTWLNEPAWNWGSACFKLLLYQWRILRLPSHSPSLGLWVSSGRERYCSQPNVKRISAILGKMNKTEIHRSHYIHIHEYSTLFSHSVFLFCFKQHYFLSVYSEMTIACYRMWWDEFPKWLSFDLMQVHMTDVCPWSLCGGCPCRCFTFPSVFQQLGEQLT